MKKNTDSVRTLWIALFALAAAFLAGPLLAEGAPDFECTKGQTCNGKAATLCGSSSGDTIEGTSGADVIFGGQGRDTIRGKGGQDTICGGQDNDTIYGGDGRDWISGDADRDTIYGGKGGDTIFGDKPDGGQNAHDKCYGEQGDDIIDEDTCEDDDQP